MATEVTVKLISLSLGKIKQSKQIKSGLNLRKSLLVASVLHKAKDIYMTEIKNRRVDACPDQQQPKRPKFTSQRSLIETNTQSQDPSHTHHPSDTDSISLYSNDNENDNHAMDSMHETEEDYEAETAAAAASISSDSILDDLAAESELNKENSPPSTNDSAAATETTQNDVLTSSRLEALSFKPCLKRRCSSSSSSYTDSDFTADELDCADSKRARVDYNQSVTNPSTTEPINSLVHIFSSGLCTYNSNSNASSDIDDSDATTATAGASCYSAGRSASSTEISTFSLCRESIALTA